VTPVQLAALVVAKRAAQPFANAVQSRHDRPAQADHHISLLIAELSYAELRALAILLAEAADLELLRLVCAADDGGTVPKAAPKRKAA
jgi:hypothetical protein